MDVSIRLADKQARESFIKARDEKQAAQDRRAEKRKDRRAKRRNFVNTRRLKWRINKEVRTDLLTEKRSYLKGEASGGEYVINTKLYYMGSNWRYPRLFVEGLLEEALAKHTGFEYKVDYKTDSGEDEWCNSISIWYTLLDH